MFFGLSFSSFLAKAIFYQIILFNMFIKQLSRYYTIPSISVVISQRNEMGGVRSPKSRNLAIAQPKN